MACLLQGGNIRFDLVLRIWFAGFLGDERIKALHIAMWVRDQRNSTDILTVIRRRGSLEHQLRRGTCASQEYNENDGEPHRHQSTSIASPSQSSTYEVSQLDAV